MLSHVMIGSNDIERSKQFHNAVLGVLGAGEPFVHVNDTGQTRLFYMHDGSIETLDDVVMFYYRGIPASDARRPIDVEPLVDQSFSEMTYIVAFLRSLTGEAPKITMPVLP